MSLDRTENDRFYSGDERRVSFSLPRYSRREKLEATIDATDENQEIEPESREQSPSPEIVVKHKKKWKIKLPWKKKKIDYANEEFPDDETSNQDFPKNEEYPEVRESNSESDKENAELEIKNVDLHHDAKEKRSFSWYGQVSERKKYKTHGLSRTESEDILDNELSSVDTYKFHSKSKKSKKDIRKSKRNSYSSSEDEENVSHNTKLNRDKGSGEIKRHGNLEVENMLSKSHPNLMDPDEIMKETPLKENLNKSLDDNLDSVAIDSRDFNERRREEYMKKSSSLPNFFKKKKKKKSSYMRERKSLEDEIVVKQTDLSSVDKSMVEGELQKPESKTETQVLPPSKSENRSSHENSSQSLKRTKKRRSKGVSRLSQTTVKSRSGNVVYPNENGSSESIRKPPKNTMQKQVNEVIVHKSSKEPLHDDNLQKNNENNNHRSNNDIISHNSENTSQRLDSERETVNQSRNEVKKARNKSTENSHQKSSHREYIKNISSSLNRESKIKYPPQNSNKNNHSSKNNDIEKNFSNTFPKASNTLIRRKSYEEMINLIEEEMFDYTLSEDESSDTDGDQIDLSFNKLLGDDKEPICSDPDFKLRRTPDTDLSLSETELVYEPKILKNKIKGSSQNKNNEVNSLFKRPSEAPPHPPHITTSASTLPKNSKLPPVTSFGEMEKAKKKKLRKVPKSKAEYNSSTDSSSLEDFRESLYANMVAKRENKTYNNLRKLQNLSWKERGKTENLNIDLSDDDSPPSFSPPATPNNNNKEFKNSTSSRHESSEVLKKDRFTKDSINNSRYLPSSATEGTKGMGTLQQNKNEVKSQYNIKESLKTITPLSFPEIESKKLPPPPPSNPPPEDDPFNAPTMLKDSTLNLYRAGDFKPKYEYASNVSSDTSSLGTLSPTTTQKPYTPVYKDEVMNLQFKKLYDKHKPEILSMKNVKENKNLNSEVKMKSVREHCSQCEKEKDDETIKIEEVPTFPPSGITVKESFSDIQTPEPFSGTYTTFTTNVNKDESNTLKKQIVTFHLPSASKSGLSSEKGKSEYTISYHDIPSIDSKYQITQSQSVEELSHSLTVVKESNVSTPMSEIHKSSPVIHRQVMSVKQSNLRADMNENVIPKASVSPPVKSEKVIPQASVSLPIESEKVIPQASVSPPIERDVNHDYPNFYPKQHQKQQIFISEQNFRKFYRPPPENFIQISSPTPYTKNPAPLKSILRHSSKDFYSERPGPKQVWKSEPKLEYEESRNPYVPSDFGGRREFHYSEHRGPYPEALPESKREMYPITGFEEKQETYPQLVQTNIKYIDPRNPDRNREFNRPVKALIPSTISASYNPQIERVEIDDTSSNSDSESTPALPAYPPPPPKPQWTQQKQFLGNILYPPENPATSHSGHPHYQPQSYYTPTIIEVEGYNYEPESVYQNVIHASHV